MKKQYPITQKELKNDYIKKYFSPKSIYMAEDDLTVIIRAHLIVETLLDMLLIKHLNIEKLSLLENPYFTFLMKLELIESLGLCLDKKGIFLIAIKRLNTIRNYFAHYITTKLENQDISTITLPYKSTTEGSKTLNKYKNNNKLCFGLGVYYLLGYLEKLVFKK